MVDILLLTEHRNISTNILTQTIQKVFKAHQTHLLPLSLSEPPKEWVTLYEALGNECGIKQTMTQPFSNINKFHLQSVAFLKEEYIESWVEQDK